jgi:hypothetical protein
MAKPPRAVGLILCRRMEIDTERVEVSLVGLIPALAFASWPAPAPVLTAYAALQGGQGEGTIEVVVTRLETEQDIYSQKRWSGFANPAGITHLALPIRGYAFPAPGRYNFKLLFDGQELASRLLDVHEERSRE